jgi:hypothetical protein
MRRSLLVFCSGLVFGFKHAVSGMLKPSKMAGFPDLFGAGWETVRLCLGSTIASVVFNPSHDILFLILMCVGPDASRLLARPLNG